MKIIYLSTPYSKHPGGIEQAFLQACCAAGVLVKRGHCVYSPIAHTHPIATKSSMDPLDHALWLHFDQPFMEACDELWIIQMPGWDDSHGIEIERKAFMGMGKPVKYLSWPKLEEVPAKRQWRGQDGCI